MFPKTVPRRRISLHPGSVFERSAGAEDLDWVPPPISVSLVSPTQNETSAEGFERRELTYPGINPNLFLGEILLTPIA
jgi:hypothetical protein